MLKKIGAWFTGIFGLGCAMFTTMAVFDLINGSDTTKPGVLAGLLVFFGGLTAISAYTTRKLLAAAREDAVREREQADAPWPHQQFDHRVEPSPAVAVDIALEVKILQLAKAAQGRVTPAEVAIACTVSLDQAAAELDRLVARGHAELLVTDTGDTVYELKGIMSAQEKQHAEGVLAER
jgi:hypothetical protein